MSAVDTIEYARRYFDLGPDDTPMPTMVDIVELVLSVDPRDRMRGREWACAFMAHRSRACPSCGRAPS